MYFPLVRITCLKKLPEGNKLEKSKEKSREWREKQWRKNFKKPFVTPPVTKQTQNPESPLTKSVSNSPPPPPPPPPQRKKHVNVIVTVLCLLLNCLKFPVVFAFISTIFVWDQDCNIEMSLFAHSKVQPLDLWWSRIGFQLPAQSAKTTNFSLFGSVI